MPRAIKRVAVGRHYSASAAPLSAYRGVMAGELLDELATLAGALKGLRICHVNSSASGGGVAELLAREVFKRH